MNRRIAALALLVALTTHAKDDDREDAGVGTVIAPFTLQDQTGRSRTLDTSVRRIVATADRSGGALVEAALTDIDRTALESRQIVIVADISDAPRFIRPLIRSGMKKRDYDHWIDAAGSTRSQLPYAPDAVTLIELDALRITAVHRFTDAAALRAALAPDLAATP